MDIRKMPKGTLFRLFRETFITTSEYYYCPHHGIHKVKAHNITTGEDDEIGEVAMLGAYPIKPQEKSMTLNEIAQTFPPMHRWTREQQQTVAKAINAIIGQTFICNHPNMQGVETTVVEHHPHSSGCTLELHSPSRETHRNHSCDVFHFVEYYTPKTKE